MTHRSINFRKKFGLFEEQWKPKVVAEMNDYQFKVVKLQGDFVWHDHKETDETFIVIEGDLRIDFRDGAVHVSVALPVGIEQRGLVGDADVLLEGEYDRRAPRLVDEVSRLVSVHRDGGE